MTKKTLLIIVAAAVVLVVVIAVILAIGALQKDKPIVPNNPDNLSKIAKQAIEQNDYLAFQALFTTQSKEKVTREDFAALSKIMTEGVLYSNYTLLRLENGQMVLIYMTGPDKDGLYQIQDVKTVPPAMYELFNH